MWTSGNIDHGFLEGYSGPRWIATPDEASPPATKSNTPNCSLRGVHSLCATRVSTYCDISNDPRVPRKGNVPIHCRHATVVPNFSPPIENVLNMLRTCRTPICHRFQPRSRTDRHRLLLETQQMSIRSVVLEARVGSWVHPRFACEEISQFRDQAE